MATDSVEAQGQVQVHDGVYTIDMRPAPVAQTGMNRPEEPIEISRGPLTMRASDEAVLRSTRANAPVKVHTPPDASRLTPFAVEAIAVFGVAMVGAGAVYLGWWTMLAG